MADYIAALPMPIEQVPPALRTLILAYEAELDVLHPGWRSLDRKLSRFDHFDYDRKARTKWLLMRRKLLLTGRDWPVVVTPDGKNARQCFAHAVPAPSKPRVSTTNPESPLAVTAETRWDAPSVAPAPVSLPALAAATKSPLELVEAARAEAPQGVDPREWCAAWHKRHRKQRRILAREASP